MKKFIYFIILICGFSTSIYAQKKHELTVGYGIGSTDQVISGISDLITTGLTAGTSSSNNKYYGAIHIGYKYSLSENFSFGGTVVYESKKSDAFINNEPNGEFDYKFFTLAGEIKYKYINNDYFSLYGLAGAGGTNYTQNFLHNTLENKSTSNFHFNFQVTPIGIKFGNQIGVFAEAGFGYKGILSAGLITSF